MKGDDEDLQVFRQSLGLYADDKELQQLPFYSKFNRAVDGTLKEGDELVDVHTLRTIEDPNTNLSLKTFYEQECEKRNISKDSPLVLFAGSIT